MSSSNLVFCLFSCCIPVKGVKRSLIIDLQRNKYELIPNTLFELLMQHKNQSVQTIKSHYAKDTHQTIDEYFAFLIEHEFGFMTEPEEAQRFPSIDTTYRSPAIITNAILDISPE